MKPNTKRWIISLGILSLHVLAHCAEPFIVHEWGVLVIGETGGETVMGSPNRMIEELPAFVHRHEKVAPMKFEPWGWNKPVIHFYGRPGLDVQVDLTTAQGLPDAYFPLPLLTPTKQQAVNRSVMIIGAFHFSHQLQWTGRLSTEAPTGLPTADDGHWWHEARKIPSLYLSTTQGHERFIFYEAGAKQDPVIRGEVSKRFITMINEDVQASDPVVIIVNDQGDRCGAYIDEIPAGLEARLSAEDLNPWDEAAILKTCRRQWEACGMTAAEARAIVNIWRDDLLNTSGFLLISRMPTRLYEKMFPLEVTPKPDEQVRAGLVFDTLANEDRRMYWLPKTHAAGIALDRPRKDVPYRPVPNQENASGLVPSYYPKQTD